MSRFAGILFLMGAFMLAGTSVIAGRMAAATLGTFSIAAASLFFALIGLLPICGVRLGETVSAMKSRDWLSLFLQALFGIFLFRLFLLQGLVRTSAGEAGIITGATPAATALLAWLVLKEPLSKTRFLGIAGTIMGILVIQGIFSPDVGFSREHFLGNLLVLSAALCESQFNIISRIMGIRSSSNQSPVSDPIVQTTLVAGIAFLLCLGPALAEQPAQSLMRLDMIGWGALVWYGLFVTALAFIFWYSGIKRCDATVAAAFSGMMPLTALILSVLLLHEQPGWEQWVGGLLVTAGMALVGRE